MTDLLKGHKSFPQMVSTHILSWREALLIARANALDADCAAYYEHELKALDDILLAVVSEEANDQLIEKRLALPVSRTVHQFRHKHWIEDQWEDSDEERCNRLHGLPSYSTRIVQVKS